MSATFEEIEFFAFDKGARDIFVIIRGLKPLLDKEGGSVAKKIRHLDLIDNLTSIMSKRLDAMDTVNVNHGALTFFLQNLGGKLVYENKEDDEYLKKRYIEIGRKVIDLGDKINGIKLEGF